MTVDWPPPTGQTKSLITLGYAAAIGIHNGKNYLEDQYAHTTCHQLGSQVVPEQFAKLTSMMLYVSLLFYSDPFCVQVVISFQITMIFTAVVQVKGNQTQLTAELFTKKVDLVNATIFPVYGVDLVGVGNGTGNITVWPPGDVSEAVHPLVPMLWADDGSLTMATNESITMLQGLGLSLGPGQDAAKVPVGSLNCLALRKDRL